MKASALHACRSVDTYEILEPVGTGTFGSVYRARNKATGTIVALKSLKMENAHPRTEEEGLPYRALREIITLHAAAQNRHIVRLLEVVVGRGLYDIYLVLEYAEHDLARLVDSVKGSPFGTAEVKCIMLQLLDALCYLHDTLHIMHRDIKCSNILYTNRGEVKLADFGLARSTACGSRALTQPVVTLWYRAPELLLGCQAYGAAVDMWSTGCIFAELTTGSPLMPGAAEREQLELMVSLLGTPSTRIWPGIMDCAPECVTALKAMKSQPYNNLHSKTPSLTGAGYEFLNAMLTYDPEQRITAAEALVHQYFSEPPAPADKAMMPTFSEVYKKG